MREEIKYCILKVLMLVLLSITTVSADDNKIDGDLSVIVLGSGGPAASGNGRASASYLVFVGGVPRILMDAGGGAFQRLAEIGVNIKDLDIVLLSHLHIDHTGDLPPIINSIYFSNTFSGSYRTAPIHIYGPGENNILTPGTSNTQFSSTSEYIHDLFNFSDGANRYLYTQTQLIQGGDFSYSAYDLPSEINGELTTVLNKKGLIIKSTGVKHGPAPSLSFRIEYMGSTLVYTGDTSSIEPIINISKNANLVIYDHSISDDSLLSPLGPVLSELHTPPTAIGSVLSIAKPDKLVLSHISSFTENDFKNTKSIIRNQSYSGDIEMASDLDVYNIGVDVADDE